MAFLPSGDCIDVLSGNLAIISPAQIESGCGLVVGNLQGLVGSANPIGKATAGLAGAPACSGAIVYSGGALPLGVNSPSAIHADTGGGVVGSLGTATAADPGANPDVLKPPTAYITDQTWASSPRLFSTSNSTSFWGPDGWGGNAWGSSIACGGRVLMVSNTDTPAAAVPLIVTVNQGVAPRVVGDQPATNQGGQIGWWPATGIKIEDGSTSTASGTQVLTVSGDSGLDCTIKLSVTWSTSEQALAAPPSTATASSTGTLEGLGISTVTWLGASVVAGTLPAWMGGGTISGMASASPGTTSYTIHCTIPGTLGQQGSIIVASFVPNITASDVQYYSTTNITCTSFTFAT